MLRRFLHAAHVAGILVIAAGLAAGVWIYASAQTEQGVLDAARAVLISLAAGAALALPLKLVERRMDRQSARRP